MVGIQVRDVVLKCCCDGTPMPTFDPNFFLNAFKGVNNHPALRASFDVCLASLPVPPRFMQDSNTLKQAADRMHTNFHNAIVHAFEPRLVARIKFWASQGEGRRTHQVLKAITGWGIQETLSVTEAAFAESERRILDAPDTITKAWLASHVDTVLRAYHVWLGDYEYDGAASFPLTPKFDVRAHHITIDSRTAYGIVKETGLFGGNEKLFRSDPDIGWNSFFDTIGLASDKWTFTGTIDTDGEAATAHFVALKDARELAAIAAVKEAKHVRFSEAAERKRARLEDPKAAERALVAARKERARAAAAKRVARRRPRATTSRASLPTVTAPTTPARTPTSSAQSTKWTACCTAHASPRGGTTTRAGSGSCRPTHGAGNAASRRSSTT